VKKGGGGGGKKRRGRGPVLYVCARLRQLIRRFPCCWLEGEGREKGEEKPSGPEFELLGEGKREEARKKAFAARNTLRATVFPLIVRTQSIREVKNRQK